MPVPSLSSRVNVPENWPSGKPLALVVDIICERWADGTAPGLSPMGNPLKAGYLDTAAVGWAEYGETTGVYRLFDIAEEVGVKCAACLNGIVVDNIEECYKALATKNGIPVLKLDQLAHLSSGSLEMDELVYFAR